MCSRFVFFMVFGFNFSKKKLVFHGLILCADFHQKFIDLGASHNNSKLTELEIAEAANTNSLC